MPRSANSSELGAVSAGKRNSKAEYVHLMTWLSDADHRNIITGAAGAAQNNGGMNSGKVVVSKSQGHVISLCSFSFPATLTLDRWTMLAKYLSEKLGSTFDSSQAENKYRYYEQKYHKAKLASQRSGFGVDEADRAKNIHTIDQKMESMCASYALWDSWFGNTQKYSPASVMSGRCPIEDRGEDQDADDAGAADNSDVVERAVNDVNGGGDGVADDAVSAAQAAAAADEGSHHDDSHPSTSPSQRSAGEVQAPPKGKSTAARAAAASAANAAKSGLLALVATSPSSVATSGKSSSSSFDQVYATVQAAKSAPMQSPCLTYSLFIYAAKAQLEMARDNNAHDVDRQTRDFDHDDRKQAREFAFQTELANRKFAFEAQSKALELAATRADKVAERNVRQRIEFEKNVTQLLDKDPTGALANTLMSFVDRRFGAVQGNEQQDPVANLLERFIGQYNN
jgi:hypothetical protein